MIRGAAASLLLLLLAQQGAAAPRLTATTTASRPAVGPLETIDYTVVVRNDGDSTPSYLRVANDISTSAMYVSSSPEWKLDEENREVSWMGQIAPGESRTFRLTLVTRGDGGGLTLSNVTELHYDGLFASSIHRLEIDHAPPKQDGVKLGAIRLNVPGLWVLGYFAFALLALLFLPSLVRRRSGWFRSGLMLVLISGGFLLIFGAIARDDARMASTFRETRCTVTDSLAKFTEGTSSTSPSRPTKRGGSWKAVFAVRYPTPEGERISISSAAQSALQFGSPGPTQQALMRLPRGGTAPCWYDPQEPSRVVLDREAGGAYCFALIPLLTLALGIGAMLKR